MRDEISHHDFQLTLAALCDPSRDSRVVAVMAGAFLDDILGKFVRVGMPGLNSDLQKKLFDPPGALSTTSARIDVARAMDRIDNSARSDLIGIARVRNRFAHNIHVSSFDHASVAPICMKLITPREMIEGRATVIGASPEKLAEMQANIARNFDASARGRFTWTALQLGMKLHNALIQLQQAKRASSSAK